jgi:hypothetical protein
MARGQFQTPSKFSVRGGGVTMDWPTRGEVVEVEWTDSASTRGWRDDMHEGDGLSTCRSAGYLLSKDRTSVKIVQSQSIHGTQAELIAIPRVAVKSITVLRRGKT